MELMYISKLTMCFILVVAVIEIGDADLAVDLVVDHQGIEETGVIVEAEIEEVVETAVDNLEQT